jgi:cob(I)alamin adenosyltransferase
MKIYTKTGDKGLTSLAGGERVAKTHDRLEAYGTVDELNAFVGLLREEIADLHDREVLERIQLLLFSAGDFLATTPDKMPAARRQSLLTADDVRMLEQEIDRIDAGLPPLKSFVLPGGCKSACLSHVCRTVARRAERNIYRIAGCTEICPEEVLIFMNRLSDYFFVLARKECHSGGKEKTLQSACK